MNEHTDNQISSFETSGRPEIDCFWVAEHLPVFLIMELSDEDLDRLTDHRWLSEADNGLWGWPGTTARHKTVLFRWTPTAAALAH